MVDWLAFVKSKKYIIVTKDRGLINECERQNFPYVGLGTPEEEAGIVDRKLRKVRA